MTATQYRTALEALGLTQLSAAQFLGRSVRSSHDYANGREIPLAIAKLLSLMLDLNLTPRCVDVAHEQYWQENQVEGKIDR